MNAKSLSLIGVAVICFIAAVTLVGVAICVTDVDLSRVEWRPQPGAEHGPTTP